MRKSLLLLALALGALAFEGAAAQAAPPTVRALPGVGPVAPLARTVRYGPYATLRRANEVARYFRVNGYNARVVYRGSLYLGTRGYAVHVWM